ncbi:hypothetical protein KGF56_003519 [Candida oxycetoniae]|uniref:Glutamine amidotransferase domain-containing protein n=1 Tax=Candida oxycetoniae TaxID=497107 RepID=A0AAI9WWX2_9ASCO|nr:uncharacterized protein KGF56_003519 [Candida oxycetoniae]KAI3403701.1 hypothetical protein KGF56_003519 [Candida oxycetoniae]
MVSQEEPHIAILVLDTPVPGVASKHGDFGDNTISLLTNSFNQIYPFHKYQLKPAENEDPKVLENTYAQLLSNISNHLIRGFVLTGSTSDAFESYPWLLQFKKFLKNTILKLAWPVVGLCFGHQVIANVLGCKVDRNSNGWEVGTTTIELNDEIYKIKDSPFLELSRKKTVEVKNELGQEKGEIEETLLYQHLNMVEFHRDVVYGGVPPGFINFGSTAKCSIQGMISVENNNSDGIKSCNVLTFQGHPEFTTAIALDLLAFKYQRKLLTELEYEKAKYHTSTLNNQGDLIGKVICKFLLQATVTNLNNN